MISRGHQVKSYGQQKEKRHGPDGFRSRESMVDRRTSCCMHEPDDHLALSGRVEHLALIKRNSRFRIAIVAVKTGLIRKK